MSDRSRDDARSLVGRLYDTYGASLYRYAVLLLGDAAAAEDVVQQVFAAVLRQGPRLDEEAHYLRRAVRNECYSHLRRLRKENEVGDERALSVTETVMRPRFTHKAVNVLRLWSQLVEVTRTEWPEKARRSADILESNRPERQAPRAGGYFNALLNPGVVLGAFSQAVDPTQLIVDRASLVAVAIERFRRDRNALPAQLSELVPQYLREIPVDPYSGQLLLFRATNDAYTVYSVGPNQQDDQGDLSSELERAQQQGWGRRLIRGTDVGVRVIQE